MSATLNFQIQFPLNKQGSNFFPVLNIDLILPLGAFLRNVYAPV